MAQARNSSPRETVCEIEKKDGEGEYLGWVRKILGWVRKIVGYLVVRLVHR